MNLTSQGQYTTYLYDKSVSMFRAGTCDKFGYDLNSLIQVKLKCFTIVSEKTKRYFKKVGLFLNDLPNIPLSWIIFP